MNSEIAHNISWLSHAVLYMHSGLTTIQMVEAIKPMILDDEEHSQALPLTSENILAYT